MTDSRLRLRRATDQDLPDLMRWFDSEAAVRMWGGPKFAYPYTAESFRNESLWDKLDRFALCDTGDRLCGFGQLYDHLGRVHLARIAVRPDCRGQGVGRQLVNALLETGRAIWPYAEASLYVFRDNSAALECYLASGFRITAEFPRERTEFAESCWFLTRPYDED